MDKIVLKNMKFYAYHGVLKQEKENGQNFFIDAEIFLNLSKPSKTDELEDTVDYSKIYDIIKNVTLNNKFKLIEALGYKILKEVFSQDSKVYEMTVRIRKPEAPIDGDFDWAEVELKRNRDDI